jgi:hypothetical protein
MPPAELPWMELPAPVVPAPPCAATIPVPAELTQCPAPAPARVELMPPIVDRSWLRR